MNVAIAVPISCWIPVHQNGHDRIGPAAVKAKEAAIGPFQAASGFFTSFPIFRHSWELARTRG
jgi:hypothetical protein